MNCSIKFIRIWVFGILGAISILFNATSIDFFFRDYSFHCLFDFNWEICKFILNISCRSRSGTRALQFMFRGGRYFFLGSTISSTKYNFWWFHRKLLKEFPLTFLYYHSRQKKIILNINFVIWIFIYAKKF